MIKSQAWENQLRRDAEKIDGMKFLAIFIYFDIQVTIMSILHKNFKSGVLMFSSIKPAPKK